MQRNRNIRVRGVRRGEPDIRKLSRALIALAQAQAEADAAATRTTAPPNDRDPDADTPPTAPTGEADNG